MSKKNQKIVKNNSFTEFLIYKTSNSKIEVEVFLHNENIWLTQKRIAELFGKATSTINEHIRNIYEEKELIPSDTMSKFGNSEFTTKPTNYYNLDVIISVGYRVNSTQATHFRIWATERLKEYIIKGFTMDDERLKNPNNIFGHDYFEEQLARVRDIRSSERRLYQKITDIYAQCSADYSLDSDITKEFFATVQNKLHFAITGKTAAEIISERVDSKEINMGLTNWKYSPKGKIRETDIIVAKNYLTEKELDKLNRIVDMYLSFAEMQAQKGVIMYMKDWVEKLNAFLKFNEKDILQNAGKISREVAETLALKEFNKFEKIKNKDYISDFDKEVKNVLEKNN